MCSDVCSTTCIVMYFLHACIVMYVRTFINIVLLVTKALDLISLSVIEEWPTGAFVHQAVCVGDHWTSAAISSADISATESTTFVWLLL